MPDPTGKQAPLTHPWVVESAIRVFDIFKPQPARFFDEKVKNGFGVMMDDAVAAAYTLLGLALLHLF